MKKLLAFAVFATLSLSAFAADPILTCTIQNSKNKKTVKASINLAKLAEMDTEASEGLDVGKDNYNFDLTVEQVKKNFQVDIMFYENNNVQDEVGGLRCLYKASIGTKVFCQEPLTNDSDKKIADFFCQVK